MDSVEDMIKALGLSGLNADCLRAEFKSDALYLFWVVNTSGKRQYMLAANHKFARILAWRSGHIHAPENGKAFKASEKFFESNPGFGSAVKRAVGDQIPGVIIQKGNHAVMGDTVYSPLYGV